MILFNFNVLAQPNTEFGSRVPDKDGMLLWRSLHETQMGRLGILVNECPNHEILEAWLRMNNVKAVMYDIVGTTEPKVTAEFAAKIIGASGARGMYFDTDPATIANTMQQGLPSILVGQPFVVRHEWATQKAMKGWDSLVEEITKQKLARAEKDWGDLA